MVDNINYLRYLKLKEGLRVNHKGYDLKYAMSPNFVFYSYNLRKDLLSKSFVSKSLFQNIDLSEFRKNIKSRSVLFTNNLPGKDHMSLVNEVMNNIENPFFFNDNVLIKIRFNIKNTISSFFNIFFNKMYRDVSLYQKIFFSLNLVYYKNLIDQLHSLPSVLDTKAYVACFSGNNESIYTTFFQKRNIKTYCLQHGLLTAFNDYKYFIPADIVSVENFNADFMLGWGEYSKKVLIQLGFSKTRYLLAGNPKYSNLKEINICFGGYKKCIVCLSRDLYFKENLLLLEIVSKFQNAGNEVMIKFHPRSDLNIYKTSIDKYNLKIIETNISIIESISLLNPDFVIVYNSTVYYEYYINGIITFRYSVGANDIPFGLNDEFVNIDELIIRINEFKNKSKEELTGEVNTVMNRFCALGVNNYGKILN